MLMVDISSQNNKINVTVSSSGNTANTNVTPDYAQYYSEKSKEWAISNRIVDNTDYSSKYYANESKKQADISTAKTTEVVESGNTAVSNIESARDNAIIDVNTAGATQVALATEQATIATNKASEVVASGNEALANIDTAKNNAITSITNQETTSKTVLIDEGATQIGLIQNEGATQVANVQSTGFYMKDDKLYYINSQGEETEFKLDDIELNNPYSLFDSKYSDHELNNLSWLKSEGQWNAKAVYTDAYDKILENVNKCVKGFLGQTMYMWGSSNGGYMTTSLTPVVGSVVYSYGSKKLVGYITEVDLTIPAVSIRDDVGGVSYTNVGRYTPSDESSSAYITDYDFVLNTADETFRLPLKTKQKFYDNTAPVVGNGMTLGLTDGTDYAGLMGEKPTGGGVPYAVPFTSSYGATVGTVPSRTGGLSNAVVYGVTTDPTKSGIETHLTEATLYLYFYVGETVQNANLIDAGRIGEQLATKTDMLQASGAGMPSNRYIDLTLGASGSTYTAPANGWFICYKGALTTVGYLYMRNNANQLVMETRSTIKGTAVTAYVPVQKGQSILVNYDAVGTINLFRFIYAEGSK